ncbi:MAG: inverse autotransporter beta domain-containing protein [Verrucomicrobia bacterium]|nr:inverse autotransporter beta domain-containing protein [Verrucomicrobiota bacterium]
MQPIKTASLLALSLMLCGFSFSKAKRAMTEPKSFGPVQAPCDIPVFSERITLRHIESKGIGYNQGYSTLEGFFTPPRAVNTTLIPFLDMRAHVFNNGKWAANAGAGIRFVSDRVYGINLYYDYRQTIHKNYNQISAGFEALGQCIDFRVNGYWPVAETRSHSFHSRIEESKWTFTKEVAMKGANAEWGGRLKGGRNIGFYLAAGPYYFIGHGKHAFGGEGRIFATIWDHFGLQLSGSYDSLFKGIVQGELSLIFPFGKRQVQKRSNVTCAQEQTLREKVYQRVDRQEIIVTKHKRYHKHIEDDGGSDSFEIREEAPVEEAPAEESRGFWDFLKR